jgi:hypothetical protein
MSQSGCLTPVETLFGSLDMQDAGAFGHSRIYEDFFGGLSLDRMY